MPYDFLDGVGGTIDSWIRYRGEADGHRLFVESETGSLSFASFDNSVQAVANGLAQAGISPGDRVAIYMHNSIDYLTLVYGILRLGAVYVPCSTLASLDELEFQLQQTGAKLLFVDDHHSQALTLASSLASPGLIVRAGPGSGDGDTTTLESIAADAPTRRTEGPTAASLAMIMYTSGTTARPKGIMFSHGNLLSTATTAQAVFQWNREDRFLHFYPMYHMLGGLTAVLPAFLTGASIVLRARFTASRFGEMLSESAATFCNMNSTHIKMALAHPETPHDAHHYVWRMHLGLSLSTDDIAMFETRFATRLCGSYGITEACGTNIAISPTDPNRPGSAGRVVRGYAAKIVDDEGKDMGVGETGELCVASRERHGLCQGYWNDPEQTASLIRDGWLYTGDIGYFDSDGFFWFVERKKDVIKRSGFNVAPAEVERVIGEVGGVRDVAVVGAPDPVREEAIVAFVVEEAAGAVTADAVLEACAERLSAYKVPQFVKFVDELPVNFLGKLERRTLREWAREVVR